MMWSSVIATVGLISYVVMKDKLVFLSELPVFMVTLY